MLVYLLLKPIKSTNKAFKSANMAFKSTNMTFTSGNMALPSTNKAFPSGLMKISVLTGHTLGHVEAQLME